MEDSPPRRSRLRGWWGLVALVGVLLVIVLGLGLLWYHSTSDLLAVREEAKARGIPTKWSDIGLTRSPSEAITRYERLKKLVLSLPDYSSLAITGKIGSGGTKAPRLQAYLPIPQEARDHHAGLNPAIIAEFLMLLDQMPDDLLVLREDRTFSEPTTEIASNRQIVRYQQERVLLAAPVEVARETERMVRFIESQDCRVLLELLVQISLVETCLNSIAGRLQDLRPRMPSLPDRLDRLSQRLEIHLINSLTGEFVFANHSCEQLDETRKLVRLDHPVSIWEDMMYGPMMRAGRAPLLYREMEWIQMARRRPTPVDLLSNAHRIKRESEDLRRWMPTDTLSLQLMQVTSVVLTMTARCQLRLQVMIAELRGSPWPIDAFDPSGKPLRRFERDGVLMGAYTVHEDGVDDSGATPKDRYFPLYGPLAPPEPTTTP